MDQEAVNNLNDISPFHVHLLPLQLLRDGKWGEQDAVILVPGDIISVKLGDIVPADCRLLEGDPLKIDQVKAVSELQH